MHPEAEARIAALLAEAGKHIKPHPLTAGLHPVMAAALTPHLRLPHRTEAWYDHDEEGREEERRERAAAKWGDE